MPAIHCPLCYRKVEYASSKPTKCPHCFRDFISAFKVEVAETVAAPAKTTSARSRPARRFTGPLGPHAAQTPVGPEAPESSEEESDYYDENEARAYSQQILATLNPDDVMLVESGGGREIVKLGDAIKR